MQALAETSLEVLRQMTEGEDSPAQLDGGLQLLLQLQSWHLGSKAKTDGSNACCIRLFIECQVSRLDQMAFINLTFCMANLCFGVQHVESRLSDTQAKKAQHALALCLAQIRTQDPQTQQANFQVAHKVPDMQLLLS